jgi:hypothetical protein
MDLFKVVGNNNLFYWVYDKPDSIHLMELIRDDRKAHFQFMGRKGLLYQNTDPGCLTPGATVFVSDLPESAEDGHDVHLKNCWVWVESQAYISGAYPDWESAEKDVRDTLTATRDCDLESCFRDIYTIDSDRSRLAQWVQMTRALMNA